MATMSGPRRRQRDVVSTVIAMRRFLKIEEVVAVGVLVTTSKFSPINRNRVPADVFSL